MRQRQRQEASSGDCGEPGDSWVTCGGPGADRTIPGQEHLRLQRKSFSWGLTVLDRGSWSAGGRRLGPEGQDGSEQVPASQTTEQGQKYVKHV